MLKENYLVSEEIISNWDHKRIILFDLPSISARKQVSMYLIAIDVVDC